MQLFSWLLFSAALLLYACGSPAPAPEATQKNSTSGTSCFLLREGKAVTAIELTVDQDTVTGYYAWEPFERDGGRGFFQGKIANNLITADFTYMIEGSIQSEEILLKMEGDRLLQGRGALEEKSGKLVIKDKSTVTWNLALSKTDCAAIEQNIQNAKEVTKIIQEQ